MNTEQTVNDTFAVHFSYIDKKSGQIIKGYHNDLTFEQAREKKLAFNKAADKDKDHYFIGIALL